MNEVQRATAALTRTQNDVSGALYYTLSGHAPRNCWYAPSRISLHATCLFTKPPLATAWRFYVPSSAKATRARETTCTDTGQVLGFASHAVFVHEYPQVQRDTVRVGECV